MEVAEWRDEIIVRNSRWVVWSSDGLRLGCRLASNEHAADGDQIQIRAFHDILLMEVDEALAARYAAALGYRRCPSSGSTQEKPRAGSV